MRTGGGVLFFQATIGSKDARRHRASRRSRILGFVAIQL